MWLQQPLTSPLPFSSTSPAPPRPPWCSCGPRTRPRPVPAPSRPGLHEKQQQQGCWCAARDLAGMAARGPVRTRRALALASLALVERARDEVLGSPDLLERIAAHVAEDDLLVWSLVCRGFQGAQRSAGRKLVTPKKGMVTSVMRVEWAMQEGLGVKRNEVCKLAAGGGHLDVLKWARGAGCEWDWRTCCALLPQPTRTPHSSSHPAPPASPTPPAPPTSPSPPSA